MAKASQVNSATILSDGFHTIEVKVMKKVKQKGLANADAIGLPHGDLMHDDNALEGFFKKREEMFAIKKMMNNSSTKGGGYPMSRKNFAALMDAIKNMPDDDKPLRDFNPNSFLRRRNTI